MVIQSKEEKLLKEFKRLKEILEELNNLKQEDVISMNISGASTKLVS